MKKPQFITLIIFLFLSAIIFLNNSFPPFSFLIGISQNIFSFPKNIIYKSKTNTSQEQSVIIKKLVADNRKLTEKLIEFERLKKDNEALRSQFEISEIIPSRLLPVKIVGFLGSGSLPQVLVIDSGKKDGIKKGMAVISGKNIVGKIDKVLENFSQVILSNNKKFSTLANVSGSNITGVIKGEGDFILLDKVIISDNLSKEDVVVTKGDISSEGFGIPQDLIIGKIKSINKVSTSSFQTAEIESMISIPDLKTVFILIN